MQFLASRSHTMQHNWQTSFNIFSVSTGSFTVKKDKVDFFKRNVFFRGYEMDYIVSLSLFFLCHHLLDVILCKEQHICCQHSSLSALGCWKKKKNLSTSIMICSVLLFFLNLFSCKLILKEVFLITPNKVGSDCLWNAVHWWQWRILQMFVLKWECSLYSNSMS